MAIIRGFKYIRVIQARRILRCQGLRPFSAISRFKISSIYCSPGSSRQRVAESTVRSWLRAYQHGGFDPLKPGARADRGEPRSLSPPLIERLIQIKEQQLTLAIRLIIDQARSEQLIAHDEQVPVSTVQMNHLKPVLKLQLSSPPENVCRAQIMNRILEQTNSESNMLLEEGIAGSSAVIDDLMVNGYGFPHWCGGPMHVKSVA